LIDGASTSDLEYCNQDEGVAMVLPPQLMWKKYKQRRCHQWLIARVESIVFDGLRSIYDVSSA